MPIEEVFYADPRLQNTAAFVGAYGAARDERDRFDMQFDERSRVANAQLSLEAEAQAMQERMRNEALAQQAYQYQGDQNFRYMAAQQDAVQKQQYADNQSAEIQQRNISAFAQLANQREARKFDLALSAQDAIIEARSKGQIDAGQFTEGQQKWERDFGMAWSAPQQMAAENEQRLQQEQFAAMEQASLDPFSGEPLMSTNQIQAWMQAGVTPDKIMGNITKLQSEARQRKQLELKANESETKEQQAVSKIETDRALAAEQNQRKWQEADENQEQRRIAADQDREITRAKAITDGMLRIADREANWDLNFANPEPAKPGEKAPPTPKRPDFDALRQQLLTSVNKAVQVPTAAPTPGAQQTTSGPPKISTPAEYAALPSGTTYIAPDGSTRTKP